MLIHRQKKAIILRLQHPEVVTTVIPTAKSFIYKGKEFVAVRHGVDEVRVLRNIGIYAPSPMEYYYDWPGHFDPFAHQIDTAGFLSLEDRAYVLNGMGTGKTLSTLWAYDYLRTSGLAHRALVITPLSTLETTWGSEIFTHLPHLEYVVLHGSRERRLELLKNDADIYLINHDGIKVKGFVEALKERSDIDLVIIDEIAQVARHAGTDRFRAMTTILNKQVPRKGWGLTGTPMPNSPTDVWAQSRLLTPGKVPPYFNRFKDMVMRQVTQFVWVPRDNALDIVHEALQPSIRYSLDECIDLPPCVFETRSVDLTPQQHVAYKDMLSRLKAESEQDGGQLVAVNESVKAQNLIQIACGVGYGTNKEEVLFDAGHRMEIIRELVEEAGTKVIVFVPFVAVIHHLAKFLTSHGISVECIYGDVSKTARDHIFHRFKKEADPKVIVAQPSAMSHGLNLTEASTIIWYAPITNNDTFEQANARIVRPGQQRTQLVVMIEGTEIERRYYKRLKEKQRVQGLLLELVQNS